MGLDAFACRAAGTKKRFEAFEMGFGAFACGVRGTKKEFGGFEGFGRFDGWQTAGFNAKKKLLGWALVPLLTAGKRQASTPRKNYWMPLLP